MIPVLMVSILFAGFDYAGYNWAVENKAPMVAYRIVQLGVQAALTYTLWSRFTWREAVAFNVLWWTWFDDFLYYALEWACRAPSRHGPLAQAINHVTWAGWTPAGIAMGTGTTKIVPLNVLIGQAAGGIGITLIILL